ncbi:MAG: hypothetical protein MJZ59_05440 [Paludibacteraceae bacterium]|nr:hypothetical protein [Paludibacteraceae bacterium]
MAQVKPMALIESMSGKVCMHSDVYFRTNKRTGNVTSGKLCNPFQGEPTAAQQATRTNFATAVTTAKAIFHATATDTENYAKLQGYKASYDNARNFGGNLYSFVLTKELKALNASD